MLVWRAGPVASLRFRTHHHPGDPPAPLGAVADRLVECDDQQAVPLKRRARDERLEVGLEPRIGRAQRAVVRVVAQVRHQHRVVGQRARRQVHCELAERHHVVPLRRVVHHIREQRDDVVLPGVFASTGPGVSHVG